MQEECLYIEAGRLPCNSLDPCNSSDPITERFAHVEGYEVCDEAFKLSDEAFKFSDEAFKFSGFSI